jgi:major membrane immunogen (membrane-anchored lipoprotein)
MKRILLLVTAFILIIALFACTQLRPEPNDTSMPYQDEADPPNESGNNGAQGNNDVSADVYSTPEGLPDGVYTGRTEKDDRGDYGEIKITITNEKVAKAEYVEYTNDSKPKTPENGFDYKQALEAFDLLPERLTITQNVDDIDDYAGATATSNKFRTAAKNAIRSGKNKVE